MWVGVFKTPSEINNKLKNTYIEFWKLKKTKIATTVYILIFLNLLNVTFYCFILPKMDGVGEMHIHCPVYCVKEMSPGPNMFFPS